ncbi:hypothetical protein ACFXK0_04295 [Nocardia sp. NPDC059177]|uniref:hypothetical protein n=1 Tax=Nocardia sp. NPDC059177 TaxID=3346759 RepID=UPI0036923411
MLVQETNPKTGEVSAIIAVFLAGLAAAANLIGAAVLVRAFLRDADLLDDSLTLFALLGALTAAFVFGYGAYLLARRDETGRWLVIVAAGAQLGLGVLALLATLVNYDAEYGIHWFAPEPLLSSLVLGFGGVPGAVTAIVNHSWAAAASAVAFGALVLVPAILPWTAAYTLARPHHAVEPTV